MKKKVKTVLCCMLLFVFCLLFVGCDKGKETSQIPLTVEDVKRLTEEKFFDEEGNAYKEYWENCWLNREENALWHYNGEEITGFEVQRIKGFDGEDDCFLIEFAPTGHFIGKFGKTFAATSFQAYPSPFKIYDVPQERRYAYDVGDGRFICGIDREPGKIVQITATSSLQKIFSSPYGAGTNRRGYFNAYLSAERRWEETYTGYLDSATLTWYDPDPKEVDPSLVYCGARMFNSNGEKETTFTSAIVYTLDELKDLCAEWGNVAFVDVSKSEVHTYPDYADEMNKILRGYSEGFFQNRALLILTTEGDPDSLTVKDVLADGNVLTVEKGSRLGVEKKTSTTVTLLIEINKEKTLSVDTIRIE